MNPNPEDKKPDHSEPEPKDAPPFFRRRDMTAEWQGRMYDMLPCESISLKDFYARAKQRREEAKDKPQPDPNRPGDGSKA
jgi:hypothetical protein